MYALKFSKLCGVRFAAASETIDVEVWHPYNGQWRGWLLPDTRFWGGN